jgi:hypothetical protein
MAIFRKSLPALDRVLQYRNERVIRVFLRDHPMDRHQAEILFEETLKWLWLCHKHQLDLQKGAGKTAVSSLAIFPPMKLLDEMWHAFILCTQDYEHFCKSYFYRMIHHEPNTDEAPVSDDEKDSIRNEREQLVRYVCQELGAETMRRWFIELETFTEIKNAPPT